MLKSRSRAKSAIAAPGEPLVSTPKYYILFVEDPTTRTPFAVVPASKITNDTESRLSTQFLNNNRRKRSYPIAVCPLFKFPCRIFAKSEPKVTVLRLNKVVTSLNEKFKLLAAHVAVEQAYSSLLDDCPNKVKDGIEYMTGAVTNKRARKTAAADTTSSYTDADEVNRKYQLN